MGIRIFSEHWVPQREMFMFRCSTVSATWTFCVDQRTLEELDDDAYFDRGGIFDAFRPKIYRVARRRIENGDPVGQHAISAREIREVGWQMQDASAKGSRTGLWAGAA
jgi:hypothetical protein